jgi:hypothetical protein
MTKPIRGDYCGKRYVGRLNPPKAGLGVQPNVSRQVLWEIEYGGERKLTFLLGEDSDEWVKRQAERLLLQHYGPC